MVTHCGVGMNLGTLNSKIEELIASNTEAHKVIILSIKEQNGRVRSIELWKARMEGVSAAIGTFKFIWIAIVAGAVSLIIALVGKHLGA